MTVTADGWTDVGAATALAGDGRLDAEIEADATTPCGVVVCPRHGARFCLATGAALSPPAYEPLRIFSVREREGRIEVAAELTS